MEQRPERPDWFPVAAVIGLMVWARGLDLLSTRVLDAPLGGTLAGEQNVLHRAFGGGLELLLAVNLAAVVGLGFLVWRSARLHPRVAQPPPGLGFGAFLSAFFFAGHHPWWNIFWRKPGRTRARWLLGRMVPWPTVGVSLLAFAGNVLSHRGDAYAAAWEGLVGSPVRLVATLAAYIPLVLAAWLAWEFQRYRSAARRAVQARPA